MKYKVIRQHDENDCGIACLTMILWYYGIKANYRTVKRKAQYNINGISLEMLIDAAEKLGFDAEALKGNFEDMRKAIDGNELSLPFIVHTVNEKEMGHYVVVYKITKKYIVIADPIGKLRKLTYDDFNQSWTGYIVSLCPKNTNSINIKQENENDLKSILLFGFKGNKFFVIGILVLSALSTILSFIGSQVIGHIIDCLSTGTTKKSTEIFTGFLGDLFELKSFTDMGIEKVVFYIGFAVCFIILDIGILFALGYLRTVWNTRVSKAFMEKYYSAILSLPMNFFGKMKSGDLLSRFNEISEIKDMIIMMLLDVFVSFVVLFASSIFLLYINFILFEILIVISLVYVLVALCFKSIISETSEKALKSEAQVISEIKETIEGIDVLRYNVCEKHFSILFENKVNNLLKYSKKSALLGFTQNSINTAISIISNILILGIGIYLCAEHKISVGTLVSFIYIMYFFLDPISKIAEYQTVFQNGMIALQRYNDVIKEEKELSGIKDFPDYKVIRYHNINFGYSNMILKDVNFEIQKGEKVAIIGKSGSGKTTLVRMLVNIQKLIDGEIFLDDKKLYEINIQQIRKKIMYLSQRSFVFSGTIRDNILLGPQDISEKKLIQVCKFCFEKQNIDECQKILKMEIAENGRNLSGGQIQRILLAQTILRDPDVLILDEALSNLDVQSENSILSGIKELLPDVTLIVVTHRLNLRKYYDKIFLLEDGKISEVGR